MRPEKPPYGSAPAFSQLYEQAHPIIFRYIYSIRGGPVETVEDLTADTFWRAWRSRTSFSGEERAAISWLIKIARRLVIDDYRRTKTRGYSVDLDQVIVHDPSASPEETTLINDQMGILMNLLPELSLEQREIIMLRYGMGWKVKEIGAHLDRPENTISVILRRTLEKLRQHWPEGQSV